MKIFGIGLSRTGTKSLSKALEILNIKSVHYPTDSTTIQQIKKKEFPLSILNEYEALVDTPASVYYQELDSTYPNSKFILTTRNISSWLESMQYHLGVDSHLLRTSTPAQFELAEYLLDMYRITYKGNTFPEIIGNLEIVYRMHIDKVKSYFKDRLLVLDVGENDKWGKLCKFLNKPIPKAPYPNENQRNFRQIKNWPKGMDERYFSIDEKLSALGKARLIAYRYNTLLNLKESKILNVCLPGGELKEAMFLHNVTDWVVGSPPPSGRFEVIIAYDVLDHMNSEDDAISLLTEINRVSVLDAVFYVMCHPYSSRMGTHLFSENKAYLHLLCPNVPGQKPTLKLPKPIRVYKKWFDMTGWDIQNSKETTEQIEDFFEPFVHLKNVNTNVQFAEYFLRKRPKLFL